MYGKNEFKIIGIVYTMERILKQYNADQEDHELEIRIKAENRNVFSQIVAQLIDKHEKPTLTKEVKITGLNSMRQTLSYDPKTNEKISTHTEQKKQLGRFNMGLRPLRHHVVLAHEKPTSDPIAFGDKPVFRAILRISFQHGENWRIDASVIATVESAGQIKARRDALFDDVRSVADFTTLITNSEILPVHNIITHYEIEVEHIAGNAVREEDIHTVANYILEMAGDPSAPAGQAGTQNSRTLSEVDKEVARLAQLIKPPSLAKQFHFKLGFKQLGNNAQTLTYEEYMKHWIPVGHYFTLKADGLTTYLIVYPDSPQELVILTSSGIERHKLPNKSFAGNRS